MEDTKLPEILITVLTVVIPSVPAFKLGGRLLAAEQLALRLALHYLAKLVSSYAVFPLLWLLLVFLLHFYY